ncbi:hypothetical protein [Rhabdothermincola sediminis]|uniref:hypothetical protein n=1 Tax=Rhabdothermincola sediminis TaxID=2751370 RepID=UPI001AA04C2E|nr:hypothetical protein [Rhabdothermincola sediminis]
MIVVVTVLAVLVVALLVVVATARSALATAETKLEALEERLDAATSEAEEAAADASEAKARAAAAHERADAAERERASLAEQLSAARAAAEQAAHESAEQIADLEQQLGALQRASRATLDAMGVWALETVRLDRLWRDQVAAGGAEPSPLSTATDPARGATEILVAVVRETAGTPVELHWEVSEPVAPVPGARLVHAIEELLGVARAADTAALRVAGGPGELVVTMATDPPSAIPDHLVAALTAAGLDLTSEASSAEVTARVPWPPDSPAWDG